MGCLAQLLEYLVQEEHHPIMNLRLLTKVPKESTWLHFLVLESSQYFIREYLRQCKSKAQKIQQRNYLIHMLQLAFLVMVQQLQSLGLQCFLQFLILIEVLGLDLRHW